jgi:WD40 repeat protein
MPARARAKNRPQYVEVADESVEVQPSADAGTGRASFLPLIVRAESSDSAQSIIDRADGFVPRRARLRPVDPDYVSRSLRRIDAGDNYRGAWFARLEPFGEVFATCASSRLVLWDVHTHTQIGVLDKSQSRWQAVGGNGTATAASSSKGIFCIGDVKGRLRVYRLGLEQSGQASPTLAWEKQLHNAQKACVSVAFSLDGALVAVGFLDGGVAVVDVQTQEEVCKRLELGGSVDPKSGSLQFSAGLLVAGSSEQVVARVWSLPNFSEVATRHPTISDEQTYRCLALCDGEIAAGTDQGDVLLLDMKEHDEEDRSEKLSMPRYDRPPGDKAIVSLAYSGASASSIDEDYRGRLRLAVAQRGGRVTLYDMQSGKNTEIRSAACIAVFYEPDAHNSGHALAFSSDNQILSTGGGSGQITLRELQPGTAFSYLSMGHDASLVHIKGETAKTPRRIRERLRGVESPKRRRSSEASRAEHEAAEEPQFLRAHSSYQISGVFSHLTESLDAQKDMEAAHAHRDAGAELTAACANESYVVMAGGGQLLSFDRVTAETCVCGGEEGDENVATDSGVPYWSAARPGNPEMIHMQKASSLAVVRYLPSLRERQIIRCDGRLQGVRYSADGEFLLMWGGFGVHVYNASSLVRVHTFKNDGSVYGACLSPDGQLIATTGILEGQICVAIRECGTGEVLHTIPETRQHMNYTCFSPTGTLLAYAFFTEGDVEHIKLVDVRSGALHLEYSRPKWSAVPVDFSPDGKWLLCQGVADSEGQIIVLDTEKHGYIDEFQELFLPLFLQCSSSTRGTVGWVPSVQPSPHPAPLLHVAAGSQLYIVDLRRAQWMFDDGIFETDQLAGAVQEDRVAQLLRALSCFPQVINMQNPIDGDTVLHHLARETSKVETLRQWLSTGTYLPIANRGLPPQRDEMTALEVAVQSGNRKAALILIGHLATITTSDLAKLASQDLRTVASKMPELVPDFLRELDTKALLTVEEAYAFRASGTDAETDAFTKVGLPGLTEDTTDDDKCSADGGAWLRDGFFQALIEPPESDVDESFREQNEEFLAAHKIVMLDGMTGTCTDSLFSVLVKNCKSHPEIYDSKIMQAVLKFKWNKYGQKNDNVEFYRKACFLAFSSSTMLAGTWEHICRGACRDSSRWYSAVVPALPTFTAMDLMMGLTALFQVVTLVCELPELQVYGVHRYFTRKKNAVDLPSAALILIAVLAHYEYGGCSPSNCGDRFEGAASYGVAFSFWGVLFAMEGWSENVGLFLQAVSAIFWKLIGFLMVYVLLMVMQLLFFMINTPNDPHFQMQGFKQFLSGTEREGATQGYDWPVLSVVRLALLGGDFVIDDMTDWHTGLMFIVFAVLFNIVMMNLLIAILSEEWTNVQATQHLYYLQSIAESIRDQDIIEAGKRERWPWSWWQRLGWFAGQPESKRFIHLVELVEETAVSTSSDTELGPVSTEQLVASGLTPEAAKLLERGLQWQVPVESLTRKVDALAAKMEANQEVLMEQLRSIAMQKADPYLY